MSAIDHFSSVVTSPVSDTAASYKDTGAALTSGNFTAGKKYLILATGQVKNTNVNRSVYIKAVHGSTDFASSEQRLETQGMWCQYFWWTVWTAVSTEGVKLQMQSEGADQADVDQLVLVGINLSDDLTENTDWVFNENTTSTTLSTSWSTSNNASITFTPSASGDWLVLTRSRFDIVSGTLQYETRINRDSDTETTPNASSEGEDASDFLIHSLFRRYTLTGSTEYTFKEESRLDATGTTEARTHSGIFALDLSAFKNVVSSYTDSDLDINQTTDFAHEILTQSFTPTTTSDVLVLFAGGFKSGSDNDITLKQRLQVDNSDSPASQTSDAYLRFSNWDVSDVGPVVDMTVINLDTTEHDIDIDASVAATASGRGYDWRSFAAFTMELSAAAAIGPQEVSRRPNPLLRM